MIEVSDIRISHVRLNGVEHDELRVVRAVLTRRLRVSPGELQGVELRRRSIDARKRDHVSVIFVVRARLRGGANAERALLDKLRRRHDDGNVRIIGAEDALRLGAGSHAPVVRGPAAAASPAPAHADGVDRDVARASRVATASRRTGAGRDLSPVPPDRRVVVVGAGCAGLFCALALARAGLHPLLVERGDDAARRTRVVRAFSQGGALDQESNIQFGVGGAGTFSDGKLATGTRSPAHRAILEELVAAGAPRSILWDAHPHIGSDVLPAVVTRLVAAIEVAGGELRTRTALVDLLVEGRRVAGITVAHADGTGTAREERIATSAVVLACGHSARDVFELLRGRGVALERKPFAMGVRIEHAQAAIDRAQYGRAAGHPALGAAPYKLSCHVGAGDGRRGVFSFCMCPGGYVVAASSEAGGVVTNGMSLSGRDGTNANAGLLADVRVGDLAGDDVLAGVELQRSCERAAFAAGGGSYVAPAQLVGDFLRGVPSAAGGSVMPTYPRGVAWGSLDGCLPAFVTDALRAGIPLLARRLRGFDAADAVLTGVETRSSSPVRVVRGEDGQSLSTPGLYPAGEGAGYAGGIMSAAADGLRTADYVIGALVG